MGTIYDYLNWRGDLSFREAPLNEVDAMIFSILSYLDFRGIVPEGHHGGVPIKAAANTYFARHTDSEKQMIGILLPKDIVKLMRALKDTRRFRSVEMRAFVNRIDAELETQFAAVTFLPGDDTVVVTYRGTDDSLAGWKENLNMSFLPVVPAQVSAVEYLHAAAAASPKERLYLSGHSKGGNLSVYATVHADLDVRRRICRAYCFDGPGFQTNMLEDPVYLKMRPVIHSLVPQASVVGMLLEHDERYTVVKSRQSGLFQHNSLLWEVMGNSFVHLDQLSAESRRTDRTMNQLLREMTHEQREEFCTAVYQMFSVEGVETLSDLMAAKKNWVSHSKNLDPKVHQTVQRMLSSLVTLNTKNLISDLFRKEKTENN